MHSVLEHSFYIGSIISSTCFDSLWIIFRENYIKQIYIKPVLYMNFMFAPCINNIKHFIVQLRHTNYKILRLLK